MSYKKIDVTFNWIASDGASINCPYCGERLNLESEFNHSSKCKCGKQFRVIQNTHVEELKED